MDHVSGGIRKISSQRRRTAAAAILIAQIFCTGCQTWTKSHEAAISSFGSGDLQVTQTALENSQKAFRSEKKLLELDQGVLDLAAGDVDQAELRFRTLRDELEHLEQADAAEQTASMLTDSRATAYSGRDFERRMVLNMAFITSLLGNGQDAFAYSLQASEASTHRRDAIIAAAEKANSGVVAENAEDLAGRATLTPVSFAPAPSIEPRSSLLDQPLALSTYLSAAVQSESISHHRETEKALSELGFWNSAFTQQSLAAESAAGFGTQCEAGNGTLHIIALVGKAPQWVSESAEATSAALLIADRIVSMAGKHTLPPTIAAVKIARPQPQPNLLPIGALKCSVKHENAAPDEKLPNLSFATVVNLNEVAEASYREHRDEEIAHAVVRRVMKKGAVYVLKEAQNVHGNSLVDLGINVAGVAWEAMEKADTRSWRMLPARIDVARIELPAGDWTTTMQLDNYQSPHSTQLLPVHIQDGRNTYVVCVIPEHSMVGNVLVGGADRATIPVK